MQDTNSIFMEIPVTINGVYAIYCMINMTLNVIGIQAVENPRVFPIVIKPALQILSALGAYNFSHDPVNSSYAISFIFICFSLGLHRKEITTFILSKKDQAREYAQSIVNNIDGFRRVNNDIEMGGI